MFRLGFRKRFAGNSDNVFDKEYIIGQIRDNLIQNNYYDIPEVRNVSEVKVNDKGTYGIIIRIDDSDIRNKFGMDLDDEIRLEILLDKDWNLSLDLTDRIAIKHSEVVFNFKDNMDITYNKIYVLIKKAIQKMLF